MGSSSTTTTTPTTTTTSGFKPVPALQHVGEEEVEVWAIFRPLLITLVFVAADWLYELALKQAGQWLIRRTLEDNEPRWVGWALKVLGWHPRYAVWSDTLETAEISKWEEAEATKMADYAKKGITLIAEDPKERTPSAPKGVGMGPRPVGTPSSPFEPPYQSTQRVKVEIFILKLG